MNTFQLKCFLTVADTMNFTVASEELYTSRSSLSRQIASLEQELGTALFERHNNMLHLTPAGKLFQEKAQFLLNEFQDTVDQIQELNSANMNTIRIGIVHNQKINSLLSYALMYLCQENPQISISFINGSHDELYEKLILNEIDVCQLPSFEGITQIWQSYNGNDEILLQVSTDPLCLAFRNDLLNITKSQITKEEIAELIGDIPVVTTSLPKRFNETYQPHFPNIRVKNYIITSSISSFPSYVTSGIAATLTSKNNILSLYPSIKMINITDAEPLHQILLCGKNRSSTCDHFLEIVKRFL